MSILCRCGSLHTQPMDIPRDSIFGDDYSGTHQALEVRSALKGHSYHIRVDCFNKNEADDIKSYLLTAELERVSFTWLTFRNSSDRIHGGGE